MCVERFGECKNFVAMLDLDHTHIFDHLRSHKAIAQADLIRRNRFIGGFL